MINLIKYAEQVNEEAGFPHDLSHDINIPKSINVDPPPLTSPPPPRKEECI